MIKGQLTAAHASGALGRFLLGTREECRAQLGSDAARGWSLMARKLLQLSRDWLHTLLPHCWAKVNRVNYGLLSDVQLR